IDSGAEILWLESPSDCPADALGFDFDGAAFSHVGHRVTFETLIDSFVLQAPGLSRIAALVHYLDVGGSQPAEASGIERVLAGLRESITDD
ncbi:chromate resistance protein ChrB domain-containing protein, partial [Pseudomonas paraeruginosa]